MRDYDEALSQLEHGLKLDNNHGHTWWTIGNVYLKIGMKEKAIEAHIKAVNINPIWKWALASTYIETGFKDKADMIISELKNNIITPKIAFGLTYINVTLDDLDEVFYWFGYQDQDVWVPWLRTWPGLESLRNDP